MRRGEPEPFALVARSRAAAAALVVVTATSGCAGSPGAEDATSPEEEERAESADEDPEEGPDPDDLRHVLVTAPDADGGLEPGDSVAVTLERTPPVGLRGEVHAPEGAGGAEVSAQELGPLPGSEGWVAATTLNVRSCPGTGCDAEGSLRRGQTAEVHAMEDGWYALDEEGTRWVSAEHLVVEEGWSVVLAELVVTRFESFYEEHLAGHSPEAGGDDPLFADWHLGVADGETLRVVLSANYPGGPAGQEVCQWAHSSAEVLEDAAGRLRGYGVENHDVEVYYRGDEEQPVARLDDGEITCILR